MKKCRIGISWIKYLPKRGPECLCNKFLFFNGTGFLSVDLLSQLCLSEGKRIPYTNIIPKLEIRHNPHLYKIVYSEYGMINICITISTEKSKIIV